MKDRFGLSAFPCRAKMEGETPMNSHANPHYMSFRKTFDSAQGMAVWGDEAYVLYHTGMCSVYSLISRDAEPICTFQLGSFNEGEPTTPYCNHANQAMFSGIHYEDNPIPLLYVTTGNDGGADQDGFYYRCAVENITRSDDPSGEVTFTSELLQTIIYNNQGLEATSWESPCWGAPAFFVDTNNRSLYIFSARYRTTKQYLPYWDRNAFIITKFPLPDVVLNSRVILTAADIVDQFTTPFDILFTQGGTLYEDKIYYTFGYGNEDYPLGLRVFDLTLRKVVASLDLSRSEFANEEIECCSFYHNKLLCNTNSGNIYSVQDGVFPMD